MKRGMEIVLILLLISVGCSRSSPEETGREFLLALQQHNFEAAASLATSETAAIVLLMKEMLIANSETGEDLDLPLPATSTEIRHLSTTEAEGYIVLEFTSGAQNFVLYGLETNGGWKIRLPRTSW